MSKIAKKAALFLLTSALLVGCYPSFLGGQADQPVINDGETDQEEDNTDNGTSDNDNNDEKDDQSSEDNSDNQDSEDNDTNEEDETDPIEEIDLSLEPNEIGQVMVLMYHSIGENESAWRRTPENFKRDLQTLYESGYRAISLKDFVNNNIDVEAGYTPVVITFDDGNRDNFNILVEDDKQTIDPNSAVGIMEEFKKEHPDFNVTATFFLNGSRPFRQSDLVEYKLKWLVDNGYDVGNHTLGHNSMLKITDPGTIQKYIGAQANYLEGLLDGYEVNTYALCNGERPHKSLYSYLAEGSYEGNDYKNIAILEVGWDPSVSPVDKKFNSLAIHRVRASETKVDGVGMYDWLAVFEKGSRLRYISDGNPDVITVPEKYADKVDEEKLGDKLLNLYEK